MLNRLRSLALLLLLGLVSAGQWHLLETLHAEPLRFANPGQLSPLHQLTLVSHGQLLATGNLLLALALLASWAHQLYRPARRRWLGYLNSLHALYQLFLAVIVGTSVNTILQAVAGQPQAPFSAELWLSLYGIPGLLAALLFLFGPGLLQLGLGLLQQQRAPA